MRAITLHLMLIVLLSSVINGLALSAPAQPASPTPQPQAAAQDSTAPVPVPEPSAQAMAYYRSGIGWWIIGVLWGLLIPMLFLFTGFSARLRNIAEFLGRKWFFIIGIYFALFTLINFVIDLPLSYYEEFVRQHAYGLSNQTFNKWFGDALKSLVISLLGGFLLIWIPYLLLKKSPQRWWLYTGLLAIPFLVLMIMIQPVYIDPVFNQFGPMKNKALEAQILNLAERAGITGSRVYEVAKSEDTKALNAYVTGFGSTKRIVLWDNTIARLTEPELLFVMGHEMGHYVLGHIWRGIFFFSALIIVVLFTIHRTAGWLIRRCRSRFGFDHLADVASLPLLLLLFSFFMLIATPLANAFSRYQEHESDRFGLEITQNNHAAATAFVKLQTDNLANPRPGFLIKLMQASHPPLGERIEFCNEYRPWAKNEPLAYGDLFRRQK